MLSMGKSTISTGPFSIITRGYTILSRIDEDVPTLVLMALVIFTFFSKKIMLIDWVEKYSCSMGDI